MKKKVNILFFILGVIFAFSPLILFEIKHNFIMLKNTFVTGSYKSFIENTNLTNEIKNNRNFIENITYIYKNLSSQLGTNILFFISFFLILIPKLKEKRDKVFIMASFLMILIFILFLNFQFVSYYLLPVSILIIFTTSIVLLNTNHKWILSFFLFLVIFSFPKGIYNKGIRKPEQYENVVNFVIDRKIIKDSDSFNIIEIAKDYNYPIGYGYRFFFRKNNFIPKSAFKYNNSDVLLIFSEISNFNIAKMDSWEIDQFGKKFLKKSGQYKFDNLILYKISKS